jgi:transposase InsO family protein
MKVTWICAQVRMTPQNYYARRKVWSRQEVDVQLVLELVRAERKYQPRLGGRKLYYLIQAELQEAGVKMGRDRLFEELGKAGLLVERKPSAWPKTTHFDAHLPVFQNLIKGGQVSARNQVWVADITYIRTREGFLYLALITDKWSRKIVGFHLGETLETQDSLKALAMAVQGLRSDEQPIHHSDRGSQYASHAYVQRAQRAGLKMSMTEINHSAENALAERVNGILKQEYWLAADFGDKPEARQATVQAVHLYNTRRPHTALGFKTPEMVHGRKEKK